MSVHPQDGGSRLGSQRSLAASGERFSLNQPRAASFELRASNTNRVARSSKPSCKLLQKSHITIKKQLNIIHAVLQNRDALHSHAERKAGDFRRIVIHK